MSSWFSQEMMYGHYVDADDFADLISRVADEDYDQLYAANREDKFGWSVTDSGAVYGKQILYGEGHGNDNVFAAESGILEVPLLTEDQERDVRSRIYTLWPDLPVEEIKYYIVGDYN